MSDATSTSMEMPRYQSIKKVWALKVSEVGEDVITIANEMFAPVPRASLPSDIFARGTPKPGDYLVQYEDGYWSWSPKEPFEAGYVLIGKAALSAGSPTSAPASASVRGASTCGECSGGGGEEKYDRAGGCGDLSAS